MKTQKKKLKEREESRDFFCVISDAFRIFARRSSTVLGSAWAFGIAILVIVIWGLTGPAFHYSNTWQLIINTGTTIVTFLMVFLIQNTQNRDAKSPGATEHRRRAPCKNAKTIARYTKEISRFILFLEFFLLCFHRHK